MKSNVFTDDSNIDRLVERFDFFDHSSPFRKVWGRGGHIQFSQNDVGEVVFFKH